MNLTDINIIKKQSDITKYVDALIDNNSYVAQDTKEWLSKFLDQINLPFSIMIDEYYVDRYYRDSYYIHFSGQHFDKGRFCKRIAIFNGVLHENSFYDLQKRKKLQESFIGCIVIKPILKNSIGRSLIDIEKVFLHCTNKKKIYLRRREYRVTIHGVKLYVLAFPYSMQDLVTSVCAELTVLNMMDYYAHSYSDFKLTFPSEINEIKKEYGYERTLPTSGMSYVTLTRIFSKLGFYPKLYNRDAFLGVGSKFYSKREMKRVLYYYIESGIPVAIELDPKYSDGQLHSVIGIGHGSPEYGKAEINKVYNEKGEFYLTINSADFYDQYLVMDDNCLPYQLKPFNNLADNMDVYQVMVPLYKKMYLEAADAYTICEETFMSDSVGLRGLMPGVNWNSSKIITRMYLTAGRNYKNYKMDYLKVKDKNLKYIYATTPLSRFIWVCELYFENDYRSTQECFGEIVLDATASAKSPLESIIMIRYMDNIALRKPDDDFTQIVDMINDGYVVANATQKHKGFSGINLSEIAII